MRSKKVHRNCYIKKSSGCTRNTSEGIFMSW